MWYSSELGRRREKRAHILTLHTWLIQVCYKGTLPLSTVRTVHVYLLKQPSAPTCRDAGKVFSDVPSATVRLDGGAGQGARLVYSINGEEEEETCPLVSSGLGCQVRSVGADVCWRMLTYADVC